jgi:septum formation protein
MLHHPKLYLASKSPRRQELLTAAGIRYELLDIDVQEEYPESMVAEDIAEFLARKKAETAVRLIPKDAIVLTADSIVILDNTIYGKPANKEEATTMLKALSGNHHLVVTGVFIGGFRKGVGFSDFTSVWFDHLSDEEIDFYIDQYQPFDKAGSYGIQDWLGWTQISRIEGSYANVMGLPVQRVYETLRNWNSGL